MESKAWPIAATIMFLVLVGGATYSCAETRKAITARHAACIESGGSFIPSAGRDMCIQTK